MDELHAAVRARAEQLEVSRATVDQVAGLPDGYASKLLSVVPMKNMGKISLGPMLRTLGLKLVVTEDPEALAAMSHRLPKRRQCYARANTAEVRLLREMMRANGRKGGKASQSARTPEQRQDLARNAARARWDRRRAHVRAPVAP
jgi:hypothetical protein